ncbi:MAG: hypothetical protein JO148_14880 [Acidimicrobiia bacterium]|nr:hypothetical protein [Acidimicrobiia bacterium]
MAAIVAAVELVWPKPVVVVPATAKPSPWRWSGRWWGPQNAVSGRQRPWR